MVVASELTSAHTDGLCGTAEGMAQGHGERLDIVGDVFTSVSAEHLVEEDIAVRRASRALHLKGKGICCFAQNELAC